MIYTSTGDRVWIVTKLISAIALRIVLKYITCSKSNYRYMIYMSTGDRV
jgi:hypothetical protein